MNKKNIGFKLFKSSKKKKLKLKVFYGLPRKVIFCKKTLVSNQRPNSAVEFFHTNKSKKETMHISKLGISDPWTYSRIKKKINFRKREQELLRLLDKHRGKYGKYDCIVPGSGGKDSAYAAHILKFKYGMSPLTVTWSPILYTDYGYKNFKNWILSGKFGNVSGRADEKLSKFLVKASILNVLHPFQTFILGQKIFPVKVAAKYKIPLIFYGDNPAERGNPISDNKDSLEKKSFHTLKNLDKVYLGGINYKKLIGKYKFEPKQLSDFVPLDIKIFDKLNLEVRHLGYYLNWDPQEAFYYAVKHCGFRPRPFRTDGTYTKFQSMDDKLDDLHYYTIYIKFGIGRATYDVCEDIRNDYITIDEGKRLIKKYDGEFPKRYIDEVLNYFDIEKKFFIKHVDKFRSPHLWKKENNKWKLRYTSY